MRNRLIASFAAFAAAATILFAAPLPLPTTAAWVDDVVVGGTVNAAEFFGCQQGPVVVTTADRSPAGTVTVEDIDDECAGAPMTVRVYDESLGGKTGETLFVSGFENGTDGWEPFANAGRVDRVDNRAFAGRASLQMSGRSQTFHGPSRSASMLGHGQTYVADSWVYHEGGNREPFQITLMERRADGSVDYRPIATVEVPSRQWTHLGGEITTHPQGRERTVYVEATRNATLSYFIDEMRVATPTIAAEGGWITAAGAVSLPAPTLQTDRGFGPVPGTGTMPVEVTIDGYAVPATWEYEVPVSGEVCTVVASDSLTPIPGAECGSVNVTVTGWSGVVGSRQVHLNVGFTGTGVLTDNSHRILFTVDLASVPGMPADIQWDKVGVNAGGFWVVPGYSCGELPILTAIAPGWSINAPAFVSLQEGSAGSGGVCGS